MSLVGNVLLLPLAPVRGVTWVARVIEDEAECEMAARTDPARRLEELTAKIAIGEIAPEEGAALEAELIDQILAGDGPSTEP